MHMKVSNGQHEPVLKKKPAQTWVWAGWYDVLTELYRRDFLIFDNHFLEATSRLARSNQFYV